MADRAPRPDLDIHWVNQFAVPPDQPGGTRHYDFAAELGRRGHHVHLVASDLNLNTRRYSRRRGPSDLRAVDEVIDGVPFTWLTAGSYRSNDWRRVASMAIFGLAVFAHLLRVRRRHDRTVFIGSSPQLFAALGTWAAARIRRAPFVLEVRDLWPESYTAVSGKERGPEITAMRWVADLLYRQALAIIVLAGPNAARICARGVDPAKVVNVPNGVDLVGFDDGEPSVDLSEVGTFTFVYAGAHGPANDLEIVVRACLLLQERGRSDVRVALLGDGATKESLVALAATLALTNLTFFDPVAKSTIGATLRTADAGLMVLAPVELFSYGVSPNKLFDYLGAGLPVVANVPGLVHDIVADADVGINVAAGSPLALADGMASMADDPPAGAAERGRAFVRANYDRRTLVGQVEDLLSSLVAPAPPPPGPPSPGRAQRHALRPRRAGWWPRPRRSTTRPGLLRRRGR